LKRWIWAWQSSSSGKRTCLTSVKFWVPTPPPKIKTKIKRWTCFPVI
jgi:hypothetical protein